MEPCLLALDTSTDTMALALTAPGGVWRHEEAGGAAASARLVPAAMALLAEAGLTLDRLDAIGFGAGPGAFTGLRTACAVAQGFGLGAGRPLLALDSLMIVVEDAFDPQATLPAGALWWAAVDARMDEVYAAAYRRSGDGWQVAVAPALYTLPALQNAWSREPPQAVAGNALEVFGTRLGLAEGSGLLRGVAEGSGSPLRAPRPHARAEALARVARQAWHAGAAIDAADALPLYLRDKVALTTDERRARKEAA